MIGPDMLGSWKTRLDHEAIKFQNGSVPFELIWRVERLRAATSSESSITSVVLVSDITAGGVVSSGTVIVVSLIALHPPRVSKQRERNVAHRYCIIVRKKI